MLNAVSKSSISAEAEFCESEIWTAGEDGLETYYIYGLLAADSVIYAFAEGRIERRDKSPHHIALKRSMDNGLSWSKNHFLAVSRHGECFCNPTPVFDRRTNQIHLLYAQNYDNRTSKLFLISSSDNGVNWTLPKDLTKLFDDPYQRTFHLPGPGHAIQLSGGRLIAQIWHRRSIDFEPHLRNYGISMIFSDDGGKSWHQGGMIYSETAQLNESRIVELCDGSLLLNARSGAFVTSPRFFSRSFDQGLSWTKPEEVKSLPAAFATDAGFAGFQNEGQDQLIFTHPKELNSRNNLTVYLSDTKGQSWKIAKTIYAGATGYSDAVILPDSSIDVVYGKDLLNENFDVEGNIQTTVFARFSLNWLRK